MAFFVAGSPFTVELIDLSDNTQVASAGGTNTQSLQPTAGFIYMVENINMNIPAPAGASANDHTMDIGYQGSDDDGLLRITSNFNATMQMARYAISGTTVLPSNATVQGTVLSSHRWVCSNDLPIDFLYTNDTDANQTGTRTLIIAVRKYQELVQ